MRRMLLLVAAACLGSAILAAPSLAGHTAIVKPPKIFKKQLADVRADSGIDVYLPSSIRVYTKARRVKGDVFVSDGSYTFNLGVVRNCRGATVCNLANFTGVRGAQPAFGRKVRLTGGRRGYWTDISCGASCAPAAIQWVEDDVLYEIATKGVRSPRHARATLVKLANSAIKAGPR